MILLAFQCFTRIIGFTPEYIQVRNNDHHRKTTAFLEALPYLQKFRGRTFLIKLGGSAMEEEALVDRVLQDVVFLEAVGINPVVVHGGGKAISAAMKKHGLEAKFINGLRVTDAETIDIVEQVLTHEINPNLVRGIQSFGGKAVGISGTEIFVGEKTAGRDPATGVAMDLGFVGKVVDCQIAKITEAIQAEIVPVVSPLALDKTTGNSLNVNADVAAAALADKIGAVKLIYLSDVPGVLENPGNPLSILPTLRPADIEVLKTRGVISGGMIPKVTAAVNALQNGVNKVHFIDGRMEHSLMLEIFTDIGIGTEIIL